MEECLNWSLQVCRSQLREVEEDKTYAKGRGDKVALKIKM